MNTPHVTKIHHRVNDKTWTSWEQKNIMPAQDRFIERQCRYRTGADAVNVVCLLLENLPGGICEGKQGDNVCR
jgi:hypothetical protein